MEELPHQNFWSIAMFFVILFSILLVLCVAAGVLITVAVSSGHLTLQWPWARRLVAQADAHLNGKGQVPKFLERLDHR